MICWRRFIPCWYLPCMRGFLPMADTLSLLGNLAGARLKERGLVLACAESCTGGWGAQTITAGGGRSQRVDRGFFTFSNPPKQDMPGGPGANPAPIRPGVGATPATPPGNFRASAYRCSFRGVFRTLLCNVIP